MIPHRLLEDLRLECHSVLKAIFVRTMPQKFFELQMRRKSHEPEVALVSRLLPPGGVAVDVGANEGLWVYHFQKVAAEVIAFEPSHALADNLERKSADNVRVERIALSNASGTATLRFPRKQRAWGTIEKANGLHRTDHEVLSQIVNVRTLDSYELPRVDLIKIDVEGHEYSVLEGARDTLERCQPSIIVEVEESHNPGSFTKVREFLEGRGYHGFFFDKGLIPIEYFDQVSDQNPKNVGATGKTVRYINNFIFLL
jgi:FkbM family methyltransferase